MTALDKRYHIRNLRSMRGRRDREFARDASVPSNPFWRNTRTEKHRPDPPVNDPLNTDPPRSPAPDVRRKCVCEFCECKLTPQGEIIEMGEKAKRFRNHDNVLEGKDREITRLSAEIAALKVENEQLKGSGRSSHRLGAKVTS